jgi:serine protease AprX
MSPQAEARNRIRDEFGSTVAQKASDAFVSLYAGSAASPFGFEAMVGTASGATRVPTILELKPQTPIRGLESVSRTALANAQKATAEVLRLIGDERAELFALSALRRRSIEKARDTFLAECGGVLDELGKASGGPLGPLSEAVTLRTPAAQIVEACWLNDTVKTSADARTVAVVADDPRVEVIDVPRRLFREINVTVGLLGAPAFRTTRNVTGRGVNVAVIDSEISRQHAGFGSRVIHRANFTREPWGNPDSHGTAVAGIIGSFSEQITGIAPEVTIFNYKVLATVDAMNADDFGGALAIQQALEDGVHVANCSWGAGLASDGTSREARACNAAWALGLVLVKSAGNRGPGQSTLTTPADADGIIVVGATDRQGRAVQDYSSRGPFRDRSGNMVNRPHVVAPGGTPQDAMTSCVVTGGFGFCGHGTSFSAPHVTGLIALLLSESPDKTPDEIRQDVIARSNTLTGFNAIDQGAGFFHV